MRDRKNWDGLSYKIIAALCAIAVAAMLISVYLMGVLPLKYFVIAAAIMLIVTVPTIRSLINSRSGNKSKVIATVAAVIIIIVSSIGTYYAGNTISFLGKITNKVQTHDFYVVVRDDSTYEKISDIDGRTVGIMNDANKPYKDAQEKLIEKADIEFKDFGGFDQLSESLINKETEAIFLNSAYYDMAVEEVEGFTRETTRILYNVQITVESSHSQKNVNVTKDPFNIYISGIDRSGSISNISRTDVNMVITVNPKTKTILMTSIPRDYYVRLAGKGAMDKLTHSGLYGIEETTSTISNLLDTDIHYYLKVNFTTLVELVDKLGGVTIYSDHDFISKKGNYHFVQGENFVDGEQALAFARERYAFAGGDNQRVKNQQAVLAGIIDKCTSSASILKDYSGILGTVQESMQTDMSKKEMTSLAKMQLNDMTGWTILKQSLTGSGDMTPVYSIPSSNVYVMVPNQDSVEAAKGKINEVMDR